MEKEITVAEANQSAIEAVRSNRTNEAKWAKSGMIHAALYTSREAMEADQERIKAEAIMPGLEKWVVDNFSRDLPRKGSKVYESYTHEEKEQWEKFMKEKINARSYIKENFTRLLNAAFEKPKAASEPRNLRTRIMEEIATLVKACQKAEEADFDLMATIASLQNVEATVVSTTVSE